MSHLLIVGPATSALKNYLEANSHTHTRLIDLSQTKYPNQRFKGRVVSDFSDRNALFKAAHAINDKSPVAGILVTYENSILPAAQIAQELNLPGLPVAAAEACTDKLLMRQRFASAPESINPDFKLVDSADDLREFAQGHAFPLILKPANLAKSLLVTKNDTLEELLENYARALEQLPAVYKRYSPHRKPKLIVEEFLEGSIHSVDAFVDIKGTPHILDCIVDYQTGYDVGFNDNFHYSRLLPSKLNKEVQDAVKHAAELGCRALDIKNSPAHIEVIITKNGPKLVEIGARNGGYRERMHGIANGIDILGAATDLALGKAPKVQALRHDHCAVLELFPDTTGNFKQLQYEDKIRKLKSFVQLNIKVKPGQKVGKASDGFKMCAMIMLHSEDRQQFQKDLDFINENLHGLVVTA
jgi:biotin carboxylase